VCRFTAADTDRSGTLDSREIHGALRNSGFNLSFKAVDAMHRKYNKRGHGILFGDFLSMAADIALLRSKFEYLDRTRTGYIRVTLDSVISMSADL
jgi:Ca2+-binding EF-hand superfamily protein